MPVLLVVSTLSTIGKDKPKLRITGKFSVDVVNCLCKLGGMIAYRVTVMEPYDNGNGKFHVRTRGVVVAENSVEAEKLVKEHYGHEPWGWHSEASFNFQLLEPGFYPMP